MQSFLVQSAITQLHEAGETNVSFLTKWLQARKKEMEHLAQIVHMTSEREQLNLHWSEVMNSNSYFDTIYFLNMQGVRMVSVDYTHGTAKDDFNVQLSVLDKEWFQQAASGLSVFSEPFIPQNTGQASILIAVPVFDKHSRQTGILCGEIRLMTILKQVSISERDVNAYLFDQMGQPLVWSLQREDIHHSRKRNMYTIDKQGFRTGTYESSAGQTVMGVYHDIPLLHTSLGFEMERDSMLGDVTTLRNQFIVMIICGFICSMILLWVLAMKMARSVVKPIYDVMMALKQVVIGEIKDQLPEQADDDIGKAIKYFNRVIDQRNQTESTRTFQARHDLLTGLPNRLQFREILQQHYTSTTNSVGKGALLMIDFDHFKKVNDLFDHTIGDMVIKVASDRIRACLSATHWLARLSGDEFAVFLPRLERAEEACKIAQCILDTLSEPFYLSSRYIQISASIGIRISNYATDDLDQVIKDAESALCMAKKQRNSYQLYHPEIPELTSSRDARIEQLLPQAIAGEELELYYQPKVNLIDNSIYGVEALLRWHSQELGEVSPAEFIPIAESSGQISVIGEWVLDKACQQIKKWRAEGKKDVVVSVNVSMQQFEVKNLHQRIEEIIIRHNIPPHLIELELTESVFMSNPYHTLKLIQSLKNFGVLVSMDDFGTGFSSLGYLKNLPLDTVKLDPVFISNLKKEGIDSVIVQSVIQIAHSLGMKVVMEGVEKKEQLEIIRALNCDAVQGFLYFRPMPADECGVILEQ